MKEQVDISVFATNYNNAPYLEEFMESILQSSMRPKEIIIIDDGSTDNSLKILEKYQHLDTLKVIAFNKNKGRSTALNEGKKLCLGKYTLLIDPDDILLPNRIEKQWNYMEDHPEIDVLGGNVQYFKDNDKKNLNTSNFPIKKIFKSYEKGENGLLQPTIIIKTKLYNQYNYIEMVPGQDYEFFARIIKDDYQFANLPNVLNRMRIHSSSAVSKMTYQSICKIFDCRDHIFKTQTSFFKKYFYFVHLKFYRKAMLTQHQLVKLCYLTLSAICQPIKIIKRLKPH